jgi:septum site-determining protein MinC
MSTTNQSTSYVRLKGVGDSLWVTLDPTLPTDLLQAELIRLFGRLKHLAFQARVVLDPGPTPGHENLIESLGTFLKENFGVGFVSGPPKKRSADEEQSRKRDVNLSWKHRRSDVLILAGRVRSGQKVTARNHLLIMGDLNPGGEVVAAGDIFILGSMRGTAAAGQPSNEDAIILALDFRPTQIQIGGYVAAGPPCSPRSVAEYAFVENNGIVVADYLKANPFGRLPWPEVR